MPGLIVPAHLARGGAPSLGALVTAGSVAMREEPTPSREVERALALEDPRWFMKFMRFPAPHWAVCERWRENDPRRRFVRDGSIPFTSAFDMVADCPVGLSDDDSLAYIKRKLVRVTDARRQGEAEQLAIEKARTEHRQALKEELREEIIHQAKHMSPHEAQLLAGATTAHPMIAGANLTE